MLTSEEKLLASKLYSLLYNGANIYDAQLKSKTGNHLGDPILRFGMIVRELKQHMREIQNG